MNASDGDTVCFAAQQDITRRLLRLENYIFGGTAADDSPHDGPSQQWLCLPPRIPSVTVSSASEDATCSEKKRAVTDTRHQRRTRNAKKTKDCQNNADADTQAILDARDAWEKAATELSKTRRHDAEDGKSSGATIAKVKVTYPDTPLARSSGDKQGGGSCSDISYHRRLRHLAAEEARREKAAKRAAKTRRLQAGDSSSSCSSHDEPLFIAFGEDPISYLISGDV